MVNKDMTILVGTAECCVSNGNIYYCEKIVDGNKDDLDNDHSALKTIFKSFERGITNEHRRICNSRRTPDKI